MLRKPRIEWSCQSVACAISPRLAPPSRRSIARTVAFLLPSRDSRFDLAGLGSGAGWWLGVVSSVAAVSVDAVMAVLSTSAGVGVSTVFSAGASGTFGMALTAASATSGLATSVAMLAVSSTFCSLIGVFAAGLLCFLVAGVGAPFFVVATLAVVLVALLVWFFFMVSLAPCLSDLLSPHSSLGSEQEATEMFEEKRCH